MVAALLTAALAAGCGVRSTFTIRGSGTFGATPDGPSAVLRVTAEEEAVSRSGEVTWGKIHTPNVQEGFAERLAYVAAQEAAIDVLPQSEVNHRLRAAGAEPTLQPDEQELHEYTRVLDVGSYLTAHIKRSTLQYRFFWSWALVEFEVACHRADGGSSPVWQVEVCRQGRFASDREVTTEALRETFQWLREGMTPQGAQSCPK